jgi:hypothetical protein
MHVFIFSLTHVMINSLYKIKVVFHWSHYTLLPFEMDNKLRN